MSKAQILQKLLVNSFIIKAYNDKVIDSLNIETFQCYFDDSCNKVRKYGWYAWMEFKNSGETYRVASSVDIDQRFLSEDDVENFIENTKKLLIHSIDFIKTSPTLIDSFIQETKELQEYVN